jgi:hypothetical protein
MPQVKGSNLVSSSSGCVFRCRSIGWGQRIFERAGVGRGSTSALGAAEPGYGIVRGDRRSLIAGRDAGGRGVDQFNLPAARVRNGVDNARPHAGVAPADEAGVASARWSVPFGNGCPRPSRTQAPEDAVQYTPIVDAPDAARLGQQRFDRTPLEIVQFGRSQAKAPAGRSHAKLQYAKNTHSDHGHRESDDAYACRFAGFPPAARPRGGTYRGIQPRMVYNRRRNGLENLAT